MEYDNIKEGHFLERPNRFIAYVDIEGRKEKGGVCFPVFL